MAEFAVTVGKEILSFAAAHFITFGRDGCEPLHGHNYRVGVTLVGFLDRDSIVYDFIALKRDMKAILSELDHRVLIAGSNRFLEVSRSGEEVEVKHPSRRFVFPSSDVVVLPVPNTTAERLAEHLARDLFARLARRTPGAFERLEVEVEEAPGQSAHWVGSSRD